MVLKRREGKSGAGNFRIREVHEYDAIIRKRLEQEKVSRRIPGPADYYCVGVVA